MSDGPLAGLRVLDLTRMIAGGVAGMILADFGAEVVKVEQPGSGDPLRRWSTSGQPFWWKVYGRNKRYVTLNLKSDEGRAMLEALVPRFDVLVESFVPGTMEAMGLGPDVLLEWNRALVMARISGWGQTGPASKRPGFGTLIEAASGFAALNGEAEGPPILPAFPIADMTTGLYVGFAIVAAMRERERSGHGQVIDASLFESLFSLLGPLPAEYASLGRVRSRTGNRSSNSSPRGCYATRDGGWIAVSASTPAMAERFLRAYDLADVLDDQRFASNEARVRHATALDALVSDVMLARTVDEHLAVIAANGLTAVPVQTIADIAHDPHWLARELTVDVSDGDGSIRMHAPVPRLSRSAGSIKWVGGDLGQDNASFYAAELGLSSEKLAALVSRGIV